MLNVERRTSNEAAEGGLNAELRTPNFERPFQIRV